MASLSSVPAVHPSMAQPASSQIGAVCLIAGPAAILSIATDAAGAVVASQHYRQREGAPDWELSFLERVWAQDPLLQQPKAAVAVFTADPRQLVIPDELYAEAEVSLWFSSCYLHMAGEPLLTARVPGVNYRLVGALPDAFRDFMERQPAFNKALPLGISLLRTPPATGALAVITLFAGTAFGALYGPGGLKESFCSTETNSAELAYTLKRLCRKHDVAEETLLLRSNALTETDRVLTGELRTYFSDAASAGDDDSVPGSLMRVCSCA